MNNTTSEIQDTLDSFTHFLNIHYEDIIEDENGNFQLYVKKNACRKDRRLPDSRSIK